MKINNKKLIIIFGILCLCILLIGVSFALYTVSLNSIKKARLKAGTLSLQILDEDNNVISNSEGSNYEVNNSFLDIEDTYPKTNTQGLEQEGFPFKIKNNGTLAASYNLYIKVLDDSTLDESNIKYSLTRNGNSITETPQLITEADLEEDNTYKYYKIDLGELGKQETVSYNLKLWLNIDAGTDVIGKEFKASLYVKAEQWDSALPPGYTELEYLESTGTQVIKTNIIPTATIEVTIDYFMMLSGNMSYGEFIGSRTADNSADTFSFREFRTYATVNFQRASGGINTTLNCSFGTAYEVYMSQNIFRVGTNQRTSETARNGTYPLYLFAGNLANSVWRNSKCRMGIITMVDNNNLIAQFIPCLDKNNVPCMYDTVSKTTLYNQGSGEFLYKIKE